MYLIYHGIWINVCVLIGRTGKNYKPPSYPHNLPSQLALHNPSSRAHTFTCTHRMSDEELMMRKRLTVEGEGGGDDRRIMSLVKTFVR